jgi:hypothetical protein
MRHFAGASIVSGRTDIVLTGIGILAGFAIIFAGTGCIVSVCVIHFYFPPDISCLEQ